MVTQVDWNDGTGEKIYLSYGSSEGTQTISVSSDAHTGYIERSRDIVFQVSAGSTVIRKTLTVVQQGKDITIITRSDNAITRNGVAIGFE